MRHLHTNKQLVYFQILNDDGSISKHSVVLSEKNLRVWITYKPDFSLQCDKASAKAMQSLGLIKNLYQPDKRIVSNII